LKRRLAVATGLSRMFFFRATARITTCQGNTCHVTRFALHTALKSIAWGKLTFDNRCGVHHMGDEREGGGGRSRERE